MSNKNNPQIPPLRTPSSKGGIVTDARKWFKKQFGHEIYDVVKLLLETENPKELDWSEYTYLSPNSIRTIESNLTKGVYNQRLASTGFKIKNPKYVHLQRLADYALV